MSTSDLQSSLDLARLEKVRHGAGKITARCPACAEAGKDRSGSHLVILPSGKFACAANQGDAEHRRRIFALAGIPRGRDPDWRPDPSAARRRETEQARQEGQGKIRDRITITASVTRARIVEHFPWEAVDVWEDSPHRPDGDLVRFCPANFLASLFPPDAVVWTGETHHSGQDGRYADSWRTVAGIAALPPEAAVGPMVTPAVWRSGTTSRTSAGIASAPYAVLDFDGFDGRSPKTPQEMAEHVAASLAIIRWLREDMGWQLAAILHTGNKSLHAWFHTPEPDVLESLRVSALALGLDAGLIGRPEHPCRLPGQLHAKSGNRSEVWWLDVPQAA